MRSSLFILLLGIAGCSFAQDKLLFMDGRNIDVRVLGQSTLEVRYEMLKRSGVWRLDAEPTENVFSVTDSLGNERVWYFNDTIFGNDLTVPQMRSFIKGEQDARAGYNPFWTSLGGFVFGAGITTALDLEVLALTLPPLYAGAMTLPRVHVTRGSITDPLMEGDEDYAYGYAKVGRSRRVVRALLSTALGVGTGLALQNWVITPR